MTRVSSFVFQIKW